MANEEMRRLQFAFDNLQDQIEDLRNAQPEALPDERQPEVTPDKGDDNTEITEIHNHYHTDGGRAMCGVVWVNRLPLIPPADFDEAEAYKYQHLDYTPAAGKYGYYCYGVIRHDWALEHKDSFLLHLVDQEYFAKDYHRAQVAYPEVEGLDTNRVILHGVYKPEGGELEFAGGQLLTNMQFFYFLLERDCETPTEVTGAYYLAGDTGTLWRWEITNDGASIMEELDPAEFDPVEIIVRSPNGSFWRVTATSGGALRAELTNFAYPMSLLFQSDDSAFWRLTVTNDGTVVFV